MIQDKKLKAKIQDSQKKQYSSELRTKKTTSLLQPKSQVEITIDDDKPLLKYKQNELKAELPIENASNIFDLDLQNGPYKLNATSKTIYLAGHHGHIAAFNWRHKQLECEFQVKEKVHDIVGIAQSNFAVAQDHIYIYDPKGTEVHKIRDAKKPKYLQYLSYHYLLCSLNQFGLLLYQDITQGKIVSHYNVSHSPTCMGLNNSNAVIAVGEQNGTISLFTPNTGTPAMKILCHKGAISCLDYQGNYIISGGSEGIVKVWDIRTTKLLEPVINSRGLINSLSLSQKGILGVASKNEITFYKDILNGLNKPYMRHQTQNLINEIEFIKFEDYLGLVAQNKYQQIIVPESGEPNIDTYETSDFQNKKQIKEFNIKSLIQKLPPESITLFPQKIGTIDSNALQVTKKEKEILALQIKEKKIKKLKKKMRGRGKSSQRALQKQLERQEIQNRKWQNMLSQSMRVRRAEKEKKTQEQSLLQKMEQLPLKDILHVVK